MSDCTWKNKLRVLLTAKCKKILVYQTTSFLFRPMQAALDSVTCGGAVKTCHLTHVMQSLYIS